MYSLAVKGIPSRGGERGGIFGAGDAGLGGARFVPGGAVALRDDGVDERVDGLDPADVGVDELDRGEGPCAEAAP